MKSADTVLIRLLLLLFVVFIALGSSFLWWRDAVSSVSSEDTKPVIFTIQTGEGVRTIANRLKQENLIRSSTGFFLIVKFMGIGTQLQAGDFRLNRTMNAAAVAQELTHGMKDVWLTTLEGWRDEEVAGKLAKDLDIPETEFLKYAQIGYMFPDTYLIPRDSSAAGIAQIFLSTFNKKVTPQMKADSDKTGLSLKDIIILASIVEREGNTPQDRPIIAGILLKRLKADWPLQTDATLQYALGYQSQEKSWWKKFLTDADKKLQSPYNTYLNTGLPPGPISNPGLESIKSVIYPQASENWYYIHDTEGKVHFAKTLDDHNANIAKYLSN